jgi:hypothetical protein
VHAPVTKQSNLPSKIRRITRKHSETERNHNPRVGGFESLLRHLLRHRACPPSARDRAGCLTRRSSESVSGGLRGWTTRSWRSTRAGCQRGISKRTCRRSTGQTGNGGTRITYDAELTLKGALKLADPLLAHASTALGPKPSPARARRSSPNCPLPTRRAGHLADGDWSFPQPAGQRPSVSHSGPTRTSRVDDRSSRRLRQRQDLVDHVDDSV